MAKYRGILKSAYLVLLDEKYSSLKRKLRESHHREMQSDIAYTTANDWMWIK